MGKISLPELLRVSRKGAYRGKKDKVKESEDSLDENFDTKLLVSVKYQENKRLFWKEKGERERVVLEE